MSSQAGTLLVTVALALAGCRARAPWAPPDGEAIEPPPPPPAQGLRFAVYGDTRAGFATHQLVNDAMARLDPALVLHSGDLWAGYPGGAEQWKWIVSRHQNLGRLLERGRFVVARGNHESLEEYRSFTPSLSHGTGAERFSFTEGNSFFVVLGMDPSSAVEFLEQELKTPEAQRASWRFVVTHFPIYSGGLHGGRGNPDIERLCDAYKVTVYFSGHDHLYERSQQIFGQAVVDTGDALTAGRGTVFIVTGGGGAPLYPTSRIASTHVAASVNNFVEVVAGDSTVRVTAYTPEAEVIDTFTIGAAAPTLGPPPSSAPDAGLLVRPPSRRRLEGGPPIAYQPARRFLARYCADCHAPGGRAPEHERAFAIFQLDGRRQWREDQTVVSAVLDRWHLDGKIMPPPAARPQPSDAERKLILDWIGRDSPD
jgi:hypothetical protein